MKIMKCSRCGRYIHKAKQCFHCGNTLEFVEVINIVVHENIASEYARMEALVEDKKYDEAITLSYTVLEWMPNLASAFWLRLLAKNKCSTAIGLISKGFSYDEDSDFCNALRFSTDEEHSVYMDIKKIVSEIKKSLTAQISVHEYKCKSDTNIMQIKGTMAKEIDARKQKLFSLWSDLEKTEHSLYSLEMDCRLLMKEHQTGLERAAQDAFAIKTEAYRMEECPADKLHSYQVKMGNILQLSESSKDSIENMKRQHPWVKSFSDFVAQRDQKVKLINSEISSLKSYERTIQQTLDDVEYIECRHKKALRATDKYNFADAVALIGLDAFNQILRNAGVGIEASIGILPEIIKTPSEMNTTEADDAEEMDMDDYYAAWGLDED